jgi:serine phosphatase RsbU (regulator of sigma subunit)
VVLDPRRGQLTWCNAGHIAPLLILGTNTKQAKQGSALRLLKSACWRPNGPALGPFPEIGYSEEKLPWRPGDRLLMFTDGLSDALLTAAAKTVRTDSPHFSGHQPRVLE